MEGRYPNSIMLTLAECSDPSRVDEWLDWYAHVHTPDVTSAGIFTNMIRFRNTDPNHVGRQIANFSESDYEDPLEALEELKRRRDPFRDPSRYSPLTTVSPDGGPFCGIGGELQFTSNSPVRGVLIQSFELEDRANEMEFNNWFNDLRVPLVLGPGVFQSAYRYQAMADNGPERRFLCVYETDRPDVAEANSENIQLVSNSSRQESQFDGMNLQWEMTAERVFPLEGRQ
jgi:hypothetical protein